MEINMAAAVLPFLPLIISAVPQIVNLMETLFRGHGTGPQKLATGAAVLQTVATDLATAGKIPGAPDLATATALVQGTVDSMKASGQLTGRAGPTGPPGPAGLTGPAGASPTLTRADLAQILSSLRVTVDV
jgi:hypothetical protein